MKITKHTGPIPARRGNRSGASRTKLQPIFDAIRGIGVGETVRVEFDSVAERRKAVHSLAKFTNSTRAWLRDYTIAGRETALYFTRDA